MRIRSIKRFIPLGLTLAVFISLFVLFISRNSPPEVVVQLSPRHASYFEIHGEPQPYPDKYFSRSGELINVRINDKPGASEPKIVANPLKKDVFAVVSNDFSSLGSAAVFITEDGGASWLRSQIPLSVIEGDMFYADPWAAYDSKGSLAYITVAMRSSEYSRNIVLNISNDNGRSWLKHPVTVKTFESKNVKFDKPKILFGDNDELYALWIEAAPDKRDVSFCVSNDHGKSFTESRVIASGDIHFADVLLENGILYLVYSDGETINVKTSPDGGVSWSEAAMVTSYEQYSTLNKQPAIKVDGDRGVRVNSDPQGIISNGRIFITFGASSGADDDLSEVYFVSGDLNSLTFTAPKPVSNVGSDKFLPALSKDDKGNIHILYYSSENDPDNLLTEMYLASTGDFGNSFTYQNLSTEKFNPHVIVVESSYMGDYISLAINNGKLVGVWTDGRNETMDLMAGIVSLK